LIQRYILKMKNNNIPKMQSKTNIFIPPNCKLFTGYKPCEPYKVCPCEDPVPFGHRILIVNLDFIGDVLMTTAVLPAIKRKYPESTIHWITKKNAVPVLENNPYLYRVWEWNDENRMILGEMIFDEILNADKNQNSAAFTMSLKTDEKLGFGLDKNGAIVPLNPEAEYNYRMGLDDELKFKKNKRTGLEILAETWKLDYRKDEYVLQLTDEEKAFCDEFKKKLGIDEKKFVVGFNTGCSNTFPLKRMTIDQHVILINRIARELPGTVILLLGGREDTERNQEIKKRIGEKVVETPTAEGLRRGILYENLCDLVVSGDSLGMHIAIGLKKIVVPFFTISCGVEIELYGRGEKIMSDLECSPCWRKTCDNPRCLKELNLDRIFKVVAKYYKNFLSK